MSVLPNGIQWDDNNGIGFYPAATSDTYNQAYFNKYVNYSKTPLGRQLTCARSRFVDVWLPPNAHVVDVGIGSGQFIEQRPEGKAFGYDVNIEAIYWLLARNLWWDPWHADPETVTMWDSFEHMRRPELLLETVRRYVFMSLPIFDGPQHTQLSKHFRPTEHFWYFTRDGLIGYMRRNGFTLIAEADFETLLGREDIYSFAFMRG